MLGELDRGAVLNAINTKVLGPLMLAKRLAPQIAADGSFTLFSGVAAFKPAVGYLGVAITNGAADRHLAGHRRRGAVRDGRPVPHRRHVAR